MLQKAKNKKGMTMIEVTLVIAMVSVAMLMAMNLINGTSKDKDVMEKIYAERQNYISMVSKTLHELKYAKNITVQNGEEIEILKYQNRKGQKITIGFEGEKMYQQVDERKIEIAEVRLLEGAKNRVEYKDGKILFKIEFVNLKAKMDYGVVLRYE